MSVAKQREIELQFVLREQTIFFSRGLKMDRQMLTALLALKKRQLVQLLEYQTESETAVN